jgi:hypothetical protein
MTVHIRTARAAIMRPDPRNGEARIGIYIAYIDIESNFGCEV